MNLGSVCSGIEAATVALRCLGFKPQWFSEIDAFCCRLLNYYYPNVPNLGDMMGLHSNPIFNESVIDVLVGGTPCPSFSVAGLRRGMADDRGKLAFEYCRVLGTKRPRWFIWENVPGIFSSFSNEAASYEPEVWQSSDFAALLAVFQECGYSCAWRVLDAQYFGVPQRRRRVFVVGYLGADWRPPFAVLFEREGLRRDITPGREAGQEIAGTLEAGADRRRGSGISPGSIISMMTGQANAEISEEICGTLNCNHESPIISAPLTTRPYSDNYSRENNLVIEKCENIVRRLTPLEYERLQGFPDNYTMIPLASDAARYKALGNSMNIQVMRWIGGRIKKVNSLIEKTNL